MAELLNLIPNLSTGIRFTAMEWQAYWRASALVQRRTKADVAQALDVDELMG